ncbi:MAG: urate hydroxylase PuuD [Acidobacteria bacterium]|nr:urate hydroxylase PuuD [Acidobacteriota bacterium]
MTIDPTLSEWLNLVLRWVHVFAGIMWVGTTYYFTWLDARLSEEEKAVFNTGTPAQIWMFSPLSRRCLSSVAVISGICCVAG